MNSTLMKKALGVLALGSLGLMASGAQADWKPLGHGTALPRRWRDRRP